MSLKHAALSVVVAAVILVIVAAFVLRTPAPAPSSAEPDATEPIAVLPPATGQESAAEILATIEQGETAHQRDLMRLQYVVQAPVFAGDICPTTEDEQARSLCELTYGRSHVHTKADDPRTRRKAKAGGRGRGKGMGGPQDGIEGPRRAPGERRDGPEDGRPPPPQGAPEP